MSPHRLLDYGMPFVSWLGKCRSSVALFNSADVFVIKHLRSYLSPLSYEMIYTTPSNIRVSTVSNTTLFFSLTVHLLLCSHLSLSSKTIMSLITAYRLHHQNA